jgi:hypothetical protein
MRKPSSRRKSKSRLHSSAPSRSPFFSRELSRTLPHWLMRRWGFLVAPKTPKMAEHAASSERPGLRKIAPFSYAREGRGSSGAPLVYFWCESGAPVPSSLDVAEMPSGQATRALATIAGLPAADAHECPQRCAGGAGWGRSSGQLWQEMSPAHVKTGAEWQEMYTGGAPESHRR